MSLTATALRPRTDKHIQETIRTKFAESTVLTTYRHRLNTVMDYDKVIVMDKGTVAEIGHPYELVTQPTSTLKSDMVPRKSLLSKSQAPLAIPENVTFDATTGERVDTHNETLVLSRERVRTYSNRSEAGEQDGIFKSLVEQTGTETSALLYKMAEESYKKMLEKKKNA